MNNVSKNSLTVYYEKVKPKLSEKQGLVIQALVNLEKATQYQVARYLGLFPNQISGRFSELIKKDIIKIDGTLYENDRPHGIYTLNN